MSNCYEVSVEVHIGEEPWRVAHYFSRVMEFDHAMFAVSLISNGQGVKKVRINAVPLALYFRPDSLDFNLITLFCDGSIFPPDTLEEMSASLRRYVERED